MNKAAVPLVAMLLAALHCAYALGTSPGIPEHSPPFSPMPEQSYSSSTCNNATNTTDNFGADFVSTLSNGSDGSYIGALENLVNFMNAGALLGNASSAINLVEAKTILQAMQNQLSADLSASGSTFAILADSINFTAVGQILSTLSNNMSSQDTTALGNDLTTVVDATGLGYFLGNFTTHNDLSKYGSLLNQLLQTVNFTQVGALVGALPSLVTSFPQAGTLLGQIVGAANFTQTGSVLNQYIASVGTLLSGCGEGLPPLQAPAPGGY